MLMRNERRPFVKGACIFAGMALGLSFAAAGCSSLVQKHPISDKYTLTYDPPRRSGGYESLPVAIKVTRFTVASPYNTDSIIRLDRSLKEHPFSSSQWQENPADMVTRLLSRDLKRSGLFRSVLTPEEGTFFSHLLRGSVDEFFVWDTEKSWQAVIFLNIALEEREGEGNRFQKTYSTSRQCHKKNPEDLAVSMSSAMGELSGKIMEDIYLYLEERY